MDFKENRLCKNWWHDVKEGLKEVWGDITRGVETLYKDASRNWDKTFGPNPPDPAPDEEKDLNENASSLERYKYREKKYLKLYNVENKKYMKLKTKRDELKSEKEMMDKRRVVLYRQVLELNSKKKRLESTSGFHPKGSRADRYMKAKAKPVDKSRKALIEKLSKTEHRKVDDIGDYLHSKHFKGISVDIGTAIRLLDAEMAPIKRRMDGYLDNYKRAQEYVRRTKRAKKKANEDVDDIDDFLENLDIDEDT